MNKKIILLSLVLISLIAFGYFVTPKKPLNTKSDVNSSTETTQSSKVSDVIDFSESNREIRITNGRKHSVPLNKILAGGPSKDGIPSIDDPKFISITEANEFLDDEGLGLSVSIGEAHRFYPNQILVWHEIVNDEIEGQPALITYCPLCGTGIVYEPIVKEQIVEFGTSGKLWNSNLVMYDRLTDSYWSQVLGEAIVGEMTGAKLKLLPFDNITYADWKKKYPNGQVLSDETGHDRNYNRDPYGNYYNNRDLYFSVDHESDEFHPKEVTFGIEINNEHKAYTLSELNKSEEEFNDNLAGVDLRILFNKEQSTLKIYRKDNREEVVPVYGFWFSWFSVHPNTKIYWAK